MVNGQAQESAKSFLPKFLLYSGCLSVFIGSMVIFGWFIKSESLIQIHHSFVPMQFNTALGFVLSGLLWIFVCLKQSKNIAISGAILFLIGILTLSQYLFTFDLGIDQLFMEHYITTKTSHPGRMAPNTALCFILTSLSGLISLRLSKSTTNFWEHMIPVILLLIFSGVPFLGYLLKLESAYGWQTYTRMAVHTSVGFLILGAGSLLHLTGKIARSKFAFLFPVSIVGFIFLSLVSAMKQNASKDFNRRIDQQSLMIKDTFQIELDQVKLALQRMADRQAIQGDRGEKNWRMDAANYFADFNFFEHLEWYNRDEESRFSYPHLSAHSQFHIGLNNAIRLAKTNQTVALGGVYEHGNGKFFVNIVLPAYMENELQGFVLAVLNLKQFVEQNLIKIPRSDFYVALSHMEREIAGVAHYQNRSQPLLGAYRVALPFEDLGSELNLIFTPTDLLEINSYLPELILFLGILLAILSGVALQLFLNHKNLLHEASQQRDDLAIVNLEIEKSMESRSLFFARAC